ncbi:TPA: hypothetical protein IF322_001332 [Escherichia coli]|nr:hypothetical protein [Escherichia coli]
MTLIRLIGAQGEQKLYAKLIIFPGLRYTVRVHANLTNLQHRKDERRIMGAD